MKTIQETLCGIVSRVTYHNQDNGWSVLRVQPFNSPEQLETVIIHQTKVYAGATIEFQGAWILDPKYGRQFKATKANEKKPASAAALEKYLGSGLIKGVGPKTAKKIVQHFKAETLTIFESQIERLTEVPGIAKKKLISIESAWQEHIYIREVMMFLQSHGISTLFAIKIYKSYQDKAIQYVTENPYRLSNDFYGIGFFSADKVALSLGLAEDSQQRVVAAIKHVLAASRENGHCYLTMSQINEQVKLLLNLDLSHKIPEYLDDMAKGDQLRVRLLSNSSGIEAPCYYSKTLYYDEITVAVKIKSMVGALPVNQQKISAWIDKYCQSRSITLSDEQAHAVQAIVSNSFSVLTGGPGCGKTTTILVLAKLLVAMKKQILLVAPTGRAAQRMSEVIGSEAKTIHRLLEWKQGVFQKNEDQPLQADYLIADECSMLDISLSASLLKAIPSHCQVLLIGDADQLPSVGAGNVLKDIIDANVVPCFRLTKVFRQAQESTIIQYAHQINQGRTPYITSPFKTPEAWPNGTDCLFLDSDEATQEQLKFIAKVKRYFNWKMEQFEQNNAETNPYEFRTQESISSTSDAEFSIPDKFKHVDIETVRQSNTQTDELKSVIKNIHPWSTLHYGLSATAVVRKLYLEWIPKYYGQDCEIQILSPMTKGSLGTSNLNKMIQNEANPDVVGKHQFKIGEKVFREGDRVIHRRNNYDLNVFNGDIGKIISIDNEALTCTVAFLPDGRMVEYKKEDLMELDLAYAITIHKSQGSEFKAVIIPVLSQHFKMLYRNLIYTGLTRAKSLAIFVGTRKALAMAIRQQDTSLRQTALKNLLKD